MEAQDTTSSPTRADALNSTNATVRNIKDQLLAMPRGKPVPVDMHRFPDWPQDKLFMKPPSGAAIAGWEQSGVEYGRKGRVKIKQSPTRKAELIQVTLCTENGELIFQAKEVGEIAKMDAGVVNHLFSAARKVSGQDASDEDDEDDEDAEGN